MNVQGSASSDRSVPIEVQSPLQAHCFRTKLSTAVILGSLALPAFGVPLPPFSDFQFIGDTSNYTNPGVWEAKQLDITGFVPAASNALLTFDVANDVPGAPSTSLNQPTNAHLYFASTGGDFFLNFEYFFVPPDATSSVHFRDVRLTIDGQLYRDQFLAFNNDLGDPFLVGRSINTVTE